LGLPEEAIFLKVPFSMGSPMLTLKSVFSRLKITLGAAFVDGGCCLEFKSLRPYDALRLLIYRFSEAAAGS
jgi:hypothetical protein